MARAARWMRVLPADDEEFRAIHTALAGAQRDAGAPIVIWRQGCNNHDFAFVVPRRHAPGRMSRWTAWALSPALATYRYFGLPAYLGDEGVLLQGRDPVESTVAPVGECLLAASRLSIPFPVERHVEDLFRSRIEAQHDWQFETSWPTPAEARVIAESVAELTP